MEDSAMVGLDMEVSVMDTEDGVTPHPMATPSLIPDLLALVSLVMPWQHSMLKIALPRNVENKNDK